MFEKLAGNVLSKVLSKYFTDESLANNKATSANWGIWSGYISLHNLEIKTNIVNEKLRQKGQPFELVHCSIRQVEITIPWAKLSNPISARTCVAREGDEGCPARGYQQHKAVQGAPETRPPQ